MPSLNVRCHVCGFVFSSGISVSPGATVHLEGNLTVCPRCGSSEPIPDGSFTARISDFVRIIKAAPDPLGTARELLEELERAKSRDDLDKLRNEQFVRFKKWLPDSPDKIAAYIAIVMALIQLLTHEPQIDIHNDTIVVNRIEQVITDAPPPIRTQPPTLSPTPMYTDTPRNAPCPCGSGRKYKRCHGAHSQ